MAKKRQAKKLNSKKLEDRIAPGMVGGGLVDPGMVDAVEVDSGSDGAMDSQMETEAEHLEASEAPQGEYLDQAAQPVDSGPVDDAPAVESDSLDEEHQTQDNYDEFSQDNPSDDFSEDHSTWQEPDWVSANADGSVNIQPPEGVTIDPDAGIANFPMEVANEELPLPDDAEITPEGGIEMQLPEGSQYLAESNQIILQDVPLEEIPEGLEAHSNPDGSVMVNLPDEGIEVDPEAGTVSFDNHWANELAPENIEINNDGSVDVGLPPEGVEYNDDGSLHLSAEASEYMENPPADYYANADYCECHIDGSVTVTPPEGVSIDGGIAEMNFEAANEHLDLPEEFEIAEDGSSSFSLPEGCEYNEQIDGLVFQEGEIHLEEIPEGIDAHINPDGSTTVMFQEGMNYNGDTHSVEFDNFWTNEITPDSMHIEADGNVHVALPEGTEFYDDGSFTIPAESADFMENPGPDYVHDVDWSEPLADGGYNVIPPEGVQLDSAEGTLTMQVDEIDQHIPIDEGMHFNSDGTMKVDLPEGTEYNAELNQVHFPEGSIHMGEIPESVNPELHADGSISVNLQDGMTYDADSQSVHFDNYWTNQLSPEPMEFSPEGELIIDLPQDCEFHDDGSFHISPDSADFIQNPDPAYATSGPDWVESNPDGSVTLSASEHFEVHSGEGHIEMNTDYINEGFQDYIPEGMEFHPDGTMSMDVPDGTLYDAEMNSLTFQPGQMHMDEIPQEIDAQLNENGSITVNLPDGIDYDAEKGEVHLDNYWTNQLTPDCAEFSPDGHVQVDMPHDCHYFDDGSVHIPEGSCDFIENPHPDYVDHGPEWVNDNPDGSVTVDVPEGIEVNGEEGYIQMSGEMAMQELGGDLIPENIEINNDGTVSLSLPEFPTEYDAASNTLTLTELPEGFNLQEVSDFTDISYNDAGQPVLSFPDGVEYNHDAGSFTLSNELVNELAPGPMELTADGQLKINLPEDTQYFEAEGSFVISAESADFLDEAHDHDDQEFNQQQAS